MGSPSASVVPAREASEPSSYTEKGRREERSRKSREVVSFPVGLAWWGQNPARKAVRSSGRPASRLAHNEGRLPQGSRRGSEKRKESVLQRFINKK